VRSRTQLPRSIFPRARFRRGLTKTVANPEILYGLSNESAGKGMHGIICDGGASKFSCLVEWLNLVLYVEDYRLVQNAALSGGTVARPKNGLPGGSARQRTTVCTFVVFAQLMGALPVQKINRNKGRAYEKTSLTVRSQGFGAQVEVWRRYQLTGQWVWPKKRLDREIFFNSKTTGIESEA
jgi:hypothetical protein